MWIPLVLSLVAAAHNNIANRWEPFRSGAYVPVNLVFAIVFASAAAIALDISPTDIGLRGDSNDLVLPLVALALFGVGAFALGHSPFGRLIADERVIGFRGGALAFYVLVRIPFGTALVEEVVFRGVLLASWSAAGASRMPAVTISSIAFGLWHITPTIDALRVNRPDADRRTVLGAVAAAVAFTTVAGLGLSWLRLFTESLWGPVLLHAGINSLGTLAAVHAGRRSK